MAGNINLGSVQAPYWEQTIMLNPHERRKIEYVTDNFQLISASLPNALRVNFGGSMIDTPFRAGMGYRLPKPVQFVEIWNDNDVDLTVDFVLGIGQIQDNRLNVSGQVDTIATPRGFSAIKGGKSSTSSTFAQNIPANSLVAVSCISGEINVEVTSNGYVGLINLSPGNSFEIPLASSGVLGVISVNGTAEFNWLIGSY